MKICIVDDSPIVRTRLERMLNAIEGIQVIGQWGDATRASAIIRSERPDVVVLDFQLEGGTGLDVLRLIKGKSHRPIIIMLTNYASDHLRKLCESYGADYFFDKSTEFERVTETILELSRSL